jgi:hypothetical protein
VKPLNRSAFFLKEREVIVPSTHWRVALDLNTQIYEDTIATIRNDLAIIESHHKGLTPIVVLDMV